MYIKIKQTYLLPLGLEQKKNVDLENTWVIDIGRCLHIDANLDIGGSLDLHVVMSGGMMAKEIHNGHLPFLLLLYIYGGA